MNEGKHQEHARKQVHAMKSSRAWTKIKNMKQNQATVKGITRDSSDKNLPVDDSTEDWTKKASCLVEKSR